MKIQVIKKGTPKVKPIAACPWVVDDFNTGKKE